MSIVFKLNFAHVLPCIALIDDYFYPVIERIANHRVSNITEITSGQLVNFFFCNRQIGHDATVARPLYKGKDVIECQSIELWNLNDPYLCTWNHVALIGAEISEMPDGDCFERRQIGAYIRGQKSIDLQRETDET